MTESTTTIPRLAALWQAKVGSRSRRVALAVVAAAVVAAAHVGRIGTLPARIGCAVGLVLVVVVWLVLRARARRSLLTPEGVIHRVLVPTDPELGRRALRAQTLCRRVEADESVGSPELARLHLSRVLSSVSLDAVERTAARSGRKRVWTALVLAILAGAGVLFEPMRVVEGLDVLVARRGVAPVPLPWLSAVQVTVMPPAYLRSSEQRIYPALRNALPQGSVVTVRGTPERLGRHIVLTDGASEVAFVEDGAGNLVAHWTLKESANLRVAARFGDVLIPERSSIELDAVPDEAPRIELEGAPQTVELKDLSRLELRFVASDDHGLRQIDLVLRSGAREERRVLMRLDGQSRVERGAHALDQRDAFLRRMFLPVTATIEARDNDAGASGKWGKSEAVTILPPAPGEPEALRLAALEAVRDRLVDLLNHQIETERIQRDEKPDAKRLRERNQEEQELHQQAVAGLEQVVTQTFAGARISGGLSTFVLGQARALQKKTTATARRRRTEDVLLASDAGIRAQASRDAQQVAKRLGDVAEEVAEGAKIARDTEQRTQGARRSDLALGVLQQGARNLVKLGTLGADLGSVTFGELRRIRRARAADNFLEAELAARHLAARLRRPMPSFSSAGGGGVESGQGGAEGPGEASQADRQFDQLMRELDQLAAEHAEEIRRVEQSLAEAEQGLGSEELKREAAERARALRERLGDLPSTWAQEGSARAAAALGREHMAAMAHALERLDLKEAVDSGRNAGAKLDAAERLSKQDGASNWLDREGLTGASQELQKQLAWAERTLERLKEHARARAMPDLNRSGDREGELAKRARELARRGTEGEVKLPDDVSDALERAENAMQDAARELREGRGENGLTLQREAQRLLERSSSGRTDEGDDSSGESPSGSDHDGNGRDMSTSGNVPAADKARRAEQFRKRVLEGLSRQRRGRLGPAVERYAEGLLE